MSERSDLPALYATITYSCRDPEELDIRWTARESGERTLSIQISSGTLGVFHFSQSAFHKFTDEFKRFIGEK